jgi:hypothetical protein
MNKRGHKNGMKIKEKERIEKGNGKIEQNIINQKNHKRDEH